MKKIMNQPENVVYEMCKGIVMAHPQLRFIEKYKTIQKNHIDQDKVTLISGGGSGHEPAHAGFIGSGLIDTAVCGDVFASPSQVQVYQAIKASASRKGTLLIIKNYSGDIMNFKNAAHLAAEDGIEVDYVKVDDDIAVQDSLYTVGRRGVAGTVLVHKAAGAMARKGASLQEVKRVAQKAVDHVKSLGFAFSSCTVPAKGTPTFEIGDDEMEYGVGIHGEPGIQREAMISADELASRMVPALLESLKITTGEVVVLINGFGSTPLQELYLFNHSVCRLLTASGVTVHRTFVGNFMTSIDMLGASISIMKLDDELKELLDAPCESPALQISGPPSPMDLSPLMVLEKQTPSTLQEPAALPQPDAHLHHQLISLANIQHMVQVMGDCIIRNEVPFCQLDAHAGDGDFGMSVSKGFKQLQQEWPQLLVASQTIGEFLDACSLIIMEHCGGASGPLWGAAFRGAARSAGNEKSLTLEAFTSMMAASAEAIQTTGERSFGRGAVVGDKTMIDALVPAVNALKDSVQEADTLLEALKKSAAAAVQGAESTKEIAAKMGRAGTVGDRSLGHPDAGAFALGVIFTEVAASMKA